MIQPPNLCRRIAWTAAAMMLAASIALTVGCAPQEKEEVVELPPPPEPDRVLPILAEHSGTISRVRKPTRAIIRPAVEDEQTPHLPGVPIERVADDAAEQTDEPLMLIVWALGEKPSGGFGVDITDVQLFDQTLVIRGAIHRPEPGEMVTQALTHPFQVIAVPRVDYDKVYWNAVGGVPRPERHAPPQEQIEPPHRLDDPAP